MSIVQGYAARALAHVSARAQGGPVDPAWSITLNFHPDRSVAGLSILDAFARSPGYRTQYETATSNGGLTAYPGGDRWRWEQRIFGGAYDDAPAQARPRYGALNHRGRAYGGAPRFGSAHLRLRAHTLARATFCFPDSVFAPEHVGTAQQMALTELADASGRDLLDDYVEAHVHGPVDLAADVEALVLDPCYRETAVQDQAERLPCPVQWHAGFVLDVDVARRHRDYRGSTYVDLAERLSRDGRLDPALIGEAVAAGEHEPQALKRVWHYVARFGYRSDG